MKTLLIAIFLILTFSIYSAENKLPKEISEDTQTCIDCHESFTPGIVADWVKSIHSKSSLRSAMQKPLLERRISISALPENESANFIVGCYECHSLRADEHTDNFEHFGYNINVIVSPKDCETCHPVEVAEFTGTKKYHALDILRDNSLFSTMVETITGVKEIKDSEIHNLPASHLAKGESCYACHGTEIKVEGTKIVETELDDIEVPNLTNWPNHGVGRINPDGSRGSCTACHPRHSFSIEIARKPYTCAQCHLEPDVPAYNVYKESKHGNIFDSQKEKYDFEEVPWIVGKDINAPTCATCHNSLVKNLEGEIVAERTHDFSDRLWTRIFGLIYSHPQPKSGKTYEILNDDNQPLPTTFLGKPAAEYLISTEEQDKRKEKMTSVCKACHGTSFTNLQLAKIEAVNREADQMVKAATDIMLDVWNKGIENNSNPFDEQIEILWQRQWLFYANSVRYGTAMMGPDYSAFKNGWWELSQTLQKMKDLNEIKSKK